MNKEERKSHKEDKTSLWLFCLLLAAQGQVGSLYKSGIDLLYRECVVGSNTVALSGNISICLCCIAERILVLVADVLEDSNCVSY